MSRDEMKQQIVNLVNINPGIKTIDVCSLRDLAINSVSIPELIEELVKEWKILEVEYITPQMDYRIKSILFPYGTSLKVNGQEV